MDPKSIFHCPVIRTASVAKIFNCAPITIPSLSHLLQVSISHPTENGAEEEDLKRLQKAETINNGETLINNELLGVYQWRFYSLSIQLQISKTRNTQKYALIQIIEIVHLRTNWYCLCLSAKLRVIGWVHIWKIQKKNSN